MGLVTNINIETKREKEDKKPKIQLLEQPPYTPKSISQNK